MTLLRLLSQLLLLLSTSWWPGTHSSADWSAQVLPQLGQQLLLSLLPLATWAHPQSLQRRTGGTSGQVLALLRSLGCLG
jgi:hypothetical protein